MIGFYTFSSTTHIFIIFLLSICVLAQTVALLLTYYSHRINELGTIENFLEVAILCQILLFSLLYGQVVNGYNQGFVMESGYEIIRILVFCLIAFFVIAVCVRYKRLLPLIVLPFSIISLPVIEDLLGPGLPWIFIVALFFFIGRSIKIGVSSRIIIKNNISALSIVHTVDTLHSGVLFSEHDGTILVCNEQMKKLMVSLTGKAFRNASDFYDIISSRQDPSRYKKMDLEGRMVFLLSDGTAWMFTKTDIRFRMSNHVHISASNVTELWSLTQKLQLQDQQLLEKSHELKRTIENLHSLSKEKEIENARMRAHDILGQRLSVLLRIIQEEQLDYDLLASLLKGLLDELKAEHSQIEPSDELKNIRQIFDAIGVDIRFEGELPNNLEQAGLFIDIIREGSTNAVRHGFATQINIKSEPVEDEYRLYISNNGRARTTPFIPGSGIGTMRKKVAAHGGALEITHQPLFTVSVVLPGGERHV